PVDPATAQDPHPAPPSARRMSARPDPLASLVAEALRLNLGLEQERLSERRSRAEVDEARAFLLPSLAIESRYSHIQGGLNIVDLANPAYRALNQRTGN